jgi:hypothetical protein
VAVLAFVAFVWYPTTLQPNVTLTGVHFDGVACAPVLGGYANRFNATFTLTNAGSADGEAAVQFLLGNYSLGFQDYLVPKGAQVNLTGLIIWEVFPSASDCGPLNVPGPPGVSLASVTRSPEIDERALIQATVSPIATLGFSALELGGLGLVARHRGISLLQDLGVVGWGAALLTVFSAGLFASLVTEAAMTPYNYPVDWTPLFVYGPIYVILGVVLFFVAGRELLREGARRRPPRT